MELDPAAWAVLALFAFAGGLVQGSIGIGFAVVLAPVASIVEPSAVPVTVLVLAVPLAVLMAVREHTHIDVQGVVLITLGRLPGTVAGVLLVLVLSANALTVMVGVVIVVASVLSLVSPPIPLTRGTCLAGGFVSGLTGTATSVGGPPLALLYQWHRPPVLRSTLAVSFTIGLAASLTALGAAGELTWWKLRWALFLLPAMFVGLATSILVARRADAPWFRPSVLAFTTAAGAAAVVRGLL